MSNLADLSTLPGLPVSPTVREATLENLALSLARHERTFGALEQQLQREQASLARTRKLLTGILWPRPRTSKETSL